MHLKGKDWRRFRGKKPAQKCPNGQDMAIFATSPKTAHFLKKYKWGTKENFWKIAQKVGLAWKAQKHSGANGILL